MDPYTEGALAHGELGKKELERRVTLHGDSGYGSIMYVVDGQIYTVEHIPSN